MNTKKIIEYEDGDLGFQEEVKMFQKMINDGSAWSMQGSYGRRATELLRAGYCELGEEGYRDYYGNYVPSKHEVKAGTTGAPLETRK